MAPRERPTARARRWLRAAIIAGLAVLLALVLHAGSVGAAIALPMWAPLVVPAVYVLLAPAFVRRVSLGRRLAWALLTWGAQLALGLATAVALAAMGDLAFDEAWQRTLWMFAPALLLHAGAAPFVVLPFRERLLPRGTSRGPRTSAHARTSPPLAGAAPRAGGAGETPFARQARQRDAAAPAPAAAPAEPAAPRAAAESPRGARAPVIDDGEMLRIPFERLASQIPADLFVLPAHRLAASLREPGVLVVPRSLVMPQLQEGAVEIAWALLEDQFPALAFAVPVIEVRTKLPDWRLTLPLDEIVRQLPHDTFHGTAPTSDAPGIEAFPPPFQAFSSPAPPPGGGEWHAPTGRAQTPPTVPSRVSYGAAIAASSNAAAPPLNAPAPPARAVAPERPAAAPPEQPAPAPPRPVAAQTTSIRAAAPERPAVASPDRIAGTMAEPPAVARPERPAVTVSAPPAAPPAERPAAPSKRATVAPAPVAESPAHATVAAPERSAAAPPRPPVATPPERPATAEDVIVDEVASALAPAAASPVTAPAAPAVTPASRVATPAVTDPEIIAARKLAKDAATGFVAIGTLEIDVRRAEGRVVAALVAPGIDSGAVAAAATRLAAFVQSAGPMACEQATLRTSSVAVVVTRAASTTFAVALRRGGPVALAEIFARRVGAAGGRQAAAAPATEKPPATPRALAPAAIGGGVATIGDGLDGFGRVAPALFSDSERTLDVYVFRPRETPAQPLGDVAGALWQALAGDEALRPLGAVDSIVLGHGRGRSVVRPLASPAGRPTLVVATGAVDFAGLAHRQVARAAARLEAG